MLHRRKAHLRSFATTFTSVPARLGWLGAVLCGLGVIGCEGAKFETDGDGTATVGTSTLPVPPASTDETGQPALPPNVPPVEPIFGGPNPPNFSGETSPSALGSSDETGAPETTWIEDMSTTWPASSEAGQPTSEIDPSGTSDEAPEGEHCAPVADWDPAWSQWEDEVLQLVNEVRAAGADCGSEGQFGPAEPLAMDPILRCSSRLHSLDMFERDYFDHTNPDGVDPFDRMEAAGFSGSYMGENIAYGQSSPDAVMDAWVDSDGHCSNIMNPNYTLIGVGYFPGAESRRDGKQHFWTQNFGAPMRQGGFGGGGGGGFGR